MTSLLPLLPDGPRPPVTDALAGGPAAALVPGAGTPDFAGLLEALGTPAPSAPSAAAPAALPAPVAPVLPTSSAQDAAPGVESTPPQVLGLRAEAVPTSLLAAWPGGKILPEPGAPLPPALPLPAAETAAVPPRPVAAPAPATPSPPSVPAAATAPAAMAEDEAAAQLPALPEAALRPEPRKHAHVGSPVPAAPGRILVTNGVAGEEASESGSAPEDDTAHPTEAAEPLAVPAIALESVTTPQPLVQALALVPVPLGDFVTAPPAPVPPPPPSPGTVSAAALAAAVLPAPPVLRTPASAPSGAAAGAPGEPVAAPSQPAVPATPAAPVARPRAPVTGQAIADAAPVLSAEPIPASAPGAGALPEAEVSAAPATTPAPVAASAAAPLPYADRPADPRPATATPAPPAAPQLESAIAQVGDIREALRNARPAMTLTHAEFGAVSLRLEQAAPDQWRAVLASRDPGFVPAIHAALETRAIAAAADTQASFSGQSGSHQNGTSDQRYGSSPNQGQGSPQPYLGQSGTRDGEAAPDHRRPSTAAALAARGSSEAEDPAASSSASGGLFA